MSRDNPEWFPDRDMSSRPYQGDKPAADATTFSVERPTLFDLGATDDDPAIDVPGALRVQAGAARRRGRFAEAAKYEKEARAIEAKRAGKSFSKAIPAKAPATAPVPLKDPLARTKARIAARPTARGFTILPGLLLAGAAGGALWLYNRKKGGR